MRLKRVHVLSAVGAVLMICGALTGVARAQEGRAAAEVIAINGQAEVKPSGAAFRPAVLKDRLQVGDTVRTLEKSKARLLFQDDSVTVLAEKTTLEISQFSFNAATQQRQSLLKALEGKIRFTVQKITGGPPPDMTIETEVLSVGVRGTDGILETGQQNKVYLLEALTPLILTNKSTGQTINLPPMQYAVAEKFKPFQVFPITPELYQRLVEQFRLSHIYEPQNLVAPQPPASPFVLGKPGDPPGGTSLPPVTQQPLPSAGQILRGHQESFPPETGD